MQGQANTAGMSSPIDAPPRDDACQDGDKCNERRSADGDEDDAAAAMLVTLYLLLISVLIVGAVVLGLFVVVRYGFVILIAACSAVGALAVVGATLYSVTTRDAKLARARSRIKGYS